MRLVAAANHLHLRNFATESELKAGEEVSHLQQRGEAWLLSHIQQTEGVYSFFTALAQAAKQQPEQELCWWETGALCERRYRRGEHWHNLRPDALAAYRVGQKLVHFWLEWDRGTMNGRDLATKFRSYVQYIDAREWAREWARLPWLICITPEIAQERRVQRVAHVHLPPGTGLLVWTTTEVLLKERGPLAPIWSCGLLPSSYGVSSSAWRRQLLFHLHAEKEGTRRIPTGTSRELLE